MCRYGHQDVYRILGRDPLTERLTPLEFALLNRCLLEHWKREVQARDPLDGPDPASNG